MISGEREVEVLDEKGKVKTQIEYEQGKVFPNLLGNNHGVTNTIRIDSKVLDAVDSDDPTKSRNQAVEDLREVVATIGKKGNRVHTYDVLSRSPCSTRVGMQTMSHISSVYALSGVSSL